MSDNGGGAALIAECRTHRDREPMPTVAVPVTVLRLLWLAAGLVCDLALLPVVARLSQPARERVVLARAHRMLRALGARVEVYGDPTLGIAAAGQARRGALVVSNHLSFLDHVVLYALWPVRSVGKREIRHWPVFGALAKATNTIFIHRERVQSLSEVIPALSRALRDGDRVSVFPQAGIRCCLRHGRFHSALFQAAIDSATPVQPVGLRYRMADGTSTTWPTWTSGTLVSMLARTARLSGLVIEVHVLPVIEPDGAGRRELCERAESALADALGQSIPKER